MTPPTAFRIDWPAIFGNPNFRTGWRDRRQGKPPDAKIGDRDSCYALGRLMSIEASEAALPDIVLFFSMQMRTIVQQCPAMVDDLCQSAMRDAANQGVMALAIETGIGVVYLAGVVDNTEAGETS